MKHLILPCLLVVGFFGLHGTGPSQDKPVKPAEAAKAPRSVAISIFIFDLVPQRGADGTIGEPKGPIDESDLRGNKIWDKNLAIGKRILTFTAVENQKSVVKNTEIKNYMDRNPCGKKFGPGHIFQRTIGTIAEVQVQVADDKVITVDLTFADQRPYPPEMGVILGNGEADAGNKYVYGVLPKLDVGAPMMVDDAGRAFQVFDFVSHNLKTKLRIPSGKPMVVVTKDIQATSYSTVIRGEKACPPQIMLLMKASVNE